jgi:hypothetical protein
MLEINPYAPPSADLSGVPAVGVSADQATPRFFAVSGVKLFLLGLATFGLYEVYWFYQNWKLVKAREQSDIMPFWRGFFAVFFCRQLAENIERDCARYDVTPKNSLTSYAVLWVCLTIGGNIASRLTEGPLWIVALLAVWPLMVIQKNVNELNRQAAPHHDPNTRFSVLNIVGIVFGLLLLALAILGSMMPAQ